jgi:hypothetical protein
MYAFITSLILCVNAYSFDTTNVYNVSPTKYIPINNKLNELFISNVTVVNIQITIHKFFGAEGEDLKNTLYRKNDSYYIENSGKTIWSTLFSGNIESVFKEDTTSLSFFKDFCGFDTLYNVQFKNDNKTLNIFFSHYDLGRDQVREVFNNEVYFLKIHPKYMDTIRKYLKKQIDDINSFGIPCNKK